MWDFFFTVWRARVFSLKLTVSPRKINGWKMKFPFGSRPIFRDELLVSGRVYTYQLGACLNPYFLLLQGGEIMYLSWLKKIDKQHIYFHGIRWWSQCHMASQRFWWASFCGWKKFCTTRDVRNPANSGINYLVTYQLVQDFSHQQFHPLYRKRGRRGYHYNPARPTPAAGGPSFNPMNTGAKDQAKIEVLLPLVDPPNRRPPWKRGPRRWLFCRPY